MARSTLKGKSLSNNLWAEAVNASVYILNRSPTKAVRNKTPYEAWYKKKPDVSHLKVFGCVAYSLITSGNRDKFEKKGEKFIFVGYSDDSKGFRLLNPKNNQLVVSRDVIFDELAEWKWEEEPAGYSPKIGYIEPLSTQQNAPETQESEGTSIRPEDVDAYSEFPPCKTRSLDDIYQNCNMALLSVEPQSFEEALEEKSWRKGNG